jgi:hypothetical protein
MADLHNNQVQQKVLIIEDNGNSYLLTGDLGDNRYGHSKDGVVAPLLNLGWKVVKMTPFSGTNKIAMLLEKQPEN